MAPSGTVIQVEPPAFASGSSFPTSAAATEWTRKVRAGEPVTPVEHNSAIVWQYGVPLDVIADPLQSYYYAERRAGEKVSIVGHAADNYKHGDLVRLPPASARLAADPSSTPDQFVKLPNIGRSSQIALVPVGSGGDVIVRDTDRYAWWLAGKAMLWDISENMTWRTVPVPPAGIGAVAAGVIVVGIVAAAACYWHGSDVRGEVSREATHTGAQTVMNAYTLCLQQKTRDPNAACTMPALADVPQAERNSLDKAIDKMVSAGSTALVGLGVGAVVLMGGSFALSYATSGITAPSLQRGSIE